MINIILKELETKYGDSDVDIEFKPITLLFI
jgi:hypothetical protein